MSNAEWYRVAHILGRDLARIADSLERIEKALEKRERKETETCIVPTPTTSQ
jgi:hypothetical protein